MAQPEQVTSTNPSTKPAASRQKAAKVTETETREEASELPEPEQSTSNTKASGKPRVRAEFSERTEQDLAEIIESYPILWQSTHK